MKNSISRRGLLIGGLGGLSTLALKLLPGCSSLSQKPKYAPPATRPVLPKPETANPEVLDGIGYLAFDFGSHSRYLNIGDVKDPMSKVEEKILFLRGLEDRLFKIRVRNSALFTIYDPIETFGFYDNGRLLTTRFRDVLVPTDVRVSEKPIMSRHLNIDEGGRFEWVNALPKGEHCLEAYVVAGGKESISRRYVEIV